MKTDAKITGACAVLFEENCCKSVGTFGDAKKLFVVPRGRNSNMFSFIWMLIMLGFLKVGMVNLYSYSKKFAGVYIKAFCTS